MPAWRNPLSSVHHSWRNTFPFMSSSGNFKTKQTLCLIFIGFFDVHEVIQCIAHKIENLDFVEVVEFFKFYSNQSRFGHNKNLDAVFIITFVWRINTCPFVVIFQILYTDFPFLKLIPDFLTKTILALIIRESHRKNRTFFSNWIHSAILFHPPCYQDHPIFYLPLHHLYPIFNVEFYQLLIK